MAIRCASGGWVSHVAVCFLVFGVICNDGWCIQAISTESPKLPPSIPACEGHIIIPSHLSEAFRSRVDSISVSINLFSVAGVRKESLSSAPNGYFYVPLGDSYREYVLKPASPNNWKFEPEQYIVSGDSCKELGDRNFTLTGFQVSGRVIVRGAQNETAGPKDLPVRVYRHLGGDESTDADDWVLLGEAVTDYQGEYNVGVSEGGICKIIASLPSKNGSDSGEITQVIKFGEGTIVDPILIDGYTLRGIIGADSGVNVIGKLTVLLLAAEPVQRSTGADCLTDSVVESRMSLTTDERSRIRCAVYADDGTQEATDRRRPFVFRRVPPGVYTVRVAQLREVEVVMGESGMKTQELIPVVVEPINGVTMELTAENSTSCLDFTVRSCSAVGFVASSPTVDAKGEPGVIVLVSASFIEGASTDVGVPSVKNKTVQTNYNGIYAISGLVCDKPISLKLSKEGLIFTAPKTYESVSKVEGWRDYSVLDTVYVIGAKMCGLWTAVTGHLNEGNIVTVNVVVGGETRDSAQLLISQPVDEQGRFCVYVPLKGMAVRDFCPTNGVKSPWESVLPESCKPLFRDDPTALVTTALLSPHQPGASVSPAQYSIDSRNLEETSLVFYYSELEIKAVVKCLAPGCSEKMRMVVTPTGNDSDMFDTIFVKNPVNDIFVASKLLSGLKYTVSLTAKEKWTSSESLPCWARNNVQVDAALYEGTPEAKSAKLEFKQEGFEQIIKLPTREGTVSIIDVKRGRETILKAQNYQARVCIPPVGKHKVYLKSEDWTFTPEFFLMEASKGARVTVAGKNRDLLGEEATPEFEFELVRLRGSIHLMESPLVMESELPNELKVYYRTMVASEDVMTTRSTRVAEGGDGYVFFQYTLWVPVEHMASGLIELDTSPDSSHGRQKVFAVNPSQIRVKDFVPNTREAAGVPEVPPFKVGIGLRIKGSISPPIEGVKVVLKSGSGEVFFTSYSTSDGTFITDTEFSNSVDVIELNYEGFQFVAEEGDSYNFRAVRNSSVKVTVRLNDSSASATVPEVILSLSSATQTSDHRHRTLTNAEGVAHFNDVKPGEYYAQPLMKEYVFDPVQAFVVVQDESNTEVVIQATRVAFSCYGHVSSMGRETTQNQWGAAVQAVSKEGVIEEAPIEQDGSFIIKGLKPGMNYAVSVLKNGMNVGLPKTHEIAMDKRDLRDVNFMQLNIPNEHHISIGSRFHINALVSRHIGLTENSHPGLDLWSRSSARRRELKPLNYPTGPVQETDGTIKSGDTIRSLEGSNHRFQYHFVLIRKDEKTCDSTNYDSSCFKTSFVRIGLLPLMEVTSPVPATYELYILISRASVAQPIADFLEAFKQSVREVGWVSNADDSIAMARGEYMTGYPNVTRLNDMNLRFTGRAQQSVLYSEIVQIADSNLFVSPSHQLLILDPFEAPSMYAGTSFVLAVLNPSGAHAALSHGSTATAVFLNVVILASLIAVGMRFSGTDTNPHLRRVGGVLEKARCSVESFSKQLSFTNSTHLNST